MFLKKKNNIVSIYQIFIEPKGDQFKDSDGSFVNSQEGWKQKFLVEIEEKAKVNLEFENKKFKLIGMPFYNKKMEKEFEKFFAERLLNK